MGKRRKKNEEEEQDNHSHSQHNEDDESLTETKYRKLVHKKGKKSINIDTSEELSEIRFDQSDKTEKRKKHKRRSFDGEKQAKCEVAEDIENIDTVVRVHKKGKKHGRKHAVELENPENSTSKVNKEKRKNTDRKHRDDVENKGDNKVRKRKKKHGEKDCDTTDNREEMITKDNATATQPQRSEKLSEERKESRKRKKKEKMKKKMENQGATEDGKEVDPVGPDTLQLGLDYLSQWNTDRQNWKFQKVRQVWLLHNMYDAKKVNEDNFQTLLLYLEALKGRSREMTQKQAEDIVNTAEDSDGETKEVPHEKLERARQIIQLLS